MYLVARVLNNKPELKFLSLVEENRLRGFAFTSSVEDRRASNATHKLEQHRVR
jgi:hypothetical protein